MQVTGYTEQQLVTFKEEFAAKRRRQILAVIPALAAVVAIAVLGDTAGSAFLGLSAAVWRPVGIAVVVGVAGFSLLNWRCPACGRYLGRSFNPAFCPKCGVALRDPG